MKIRTVVMLAILLLGACGDNASDAGQSTSAGPQPAPSQEAARGQAMKPLPPPDDDRDGVADANDRCGETPRQAKVDARGCELDSDADGVADSRDVCPGTATGRKVDAKGCRLRLAGSEEVAVDVEFASGSASIVGDAAGSVRKAAALLEEYPETSARVEGYTDNRGAAAVNQRISAARAAAVAGVLTDSLGIDEARVMSIGMGEDSPIATNDTAEGRARNRRVVVVVMPEGGVE